jgi:hypothetical protein
MRYRALDPTGDYQLSGPFLTGADAVAQALRTAILLLRGEFWEDTSLGTPLFTGMLGLPGTQANIRAIDLIVQQRILATKGVASIVSFSSSYANRQYAVNATVATSEGGTATVNVGF